MGEVRFIRPVVPPARVCLGTACVHRRARTLDTTPCPPRTVADDVAEVDDVGAPIDRPLARERCWRGRARNCHHRLTESQSKNIGTIFISPRQRYGQVTHRRPRPHRCLRPERRGDQSDALGPPQTRDDLIRVLHCAWRRRFDSTVHVTGTRAPFAASRRASPRESRSERRDVGPPAGRRRPRSPGSSRRRASSRASAKECTAGIVLSSQSARRARVRRWTRTIRRAVRVELGGWSSSRF